MKLSITVVATYLITFDIDCFTTELGFVRFAVGCCSPSLAASVVRSASACIGVSIS